MLIGDPAYPLLPGPFKEYSNCSSDVEILFNTKLKSVCNRIECAFGRLKARWRILNRPKDFRIEFVPTVSYSCVIIHPYCETVKAPVDYDDIQKERKDSRAKQTCTHHLEKHRFYSYNSSKGGLLRENFKTYFKNTV